MCIHAGRLVLGARQSLGFEAGIIQPGEHFNAAATAPARRALESVLASRPSGGEPPQSGPSPPGKPKPPNLDGGLASGVAHADVRARTTPESHAVIEPAARSQSLHSTQTPGLSDEELESWSKARSFRVEPAGEQLGTLGDSDKIFRVLGDRSRHVALVHTRTISPKQNLSSSTLPTDKQHHWLRPRHDSPRHSFRSGQSRETAYACHSCHTEGQPCEGRMTYSWPKKKPLGAPEPTVHAGLRR